jgi:hypothetical protein
MSYIFSLGGGKSNDYVQITCPRLARCCGTGGRRIGRTSPLWTGWVDWRRWCPPRGWTAVPPAGCCARRPGPRSWNQPAHASSTQHSVSVHTQVADTKPHIKLVISVAGSGSGMRDPAHFWPLDPRWVKNKYPDPGCSSRIIFHKHPGSTTLLVMDFFQKICMWI